jgi:hypothetical protein
LHGQFIREELEKSKIEADDPNAEWLTIEEVFEPYRKKYDL